MKIGTSLKIMVVVLFAFSLLSTVTLFMQLGGMSDDGRVVNYAGIVRGATQRLVKLELAGKPLDELRGNLDKIIKGLTQGDADLQLPKASDSQFLSSMNEVSRAWEGLKQTISEFRQNPEKKDDLLSKSEEYFALANKAVSDAEQFSKRNVAVLRVIETILFCLSTAILALIWFGSRRKISAPLMELTTKVREIARGDLTVKIEARGNDEVGSLSRSMAGMVSGLRDILDHLTTSSEAVVSAVGELRAISRKTSDGAKNQSLQAAGIATAAEEMSQTIVEIARNTTVASETSSSALRAARDGGSIARQAVDTVDTVNASTAELGLMVERLNGRVTEIGDIVTVIKDIADQTNLLALNAAIEAARAGEAGRGFAVVADEVRKLAERTIRSTDEISTKIGGVQEESERTVRSMEKTSAQVSGSIEYIRKVGDALHSIMDAVSTVEDQITQIATAVEEQSSVSEEVTSNISKTSSIAQETEGMAVTVMDDVEELVRIATELRSTSSGFKL